jgi:hypothetical protein
VTKEIRQAIKIDFLRAEGPAIAVAPLGLRGNGETIKSQCLFDRFTEMRIRGTQG